MLSKMSEEYISTRAWLRDIVRDEDVILSHVSALEYLQLFVGYADEQEIDVYAKKRGRYENIHYHIIDTFEQIAFFKHGSVRCATINQTINDMLDDFQHTDQQALTEALSKYYYAHGDSFDGLVINPDNLERFQLIKEQAIAYYCEGSI